MKNEILKNPEDILLGKGIFRVDGDAIGATQGGGKFSLSREIRHTAIDGAPGKIKGLSHIETSEPTLEISALEIINADIKKRHPGIDVKTSSGTSTVTGNMQISNDDYHTVEFVGKTKAGEDVIIKVENAINLENIDFDLKEKSEVIDKVTFTGTYPQDYEEGYEPWSITYVEKE